MESTKLVELNALWSSALDHICAEAGLTRWRIEEEFAYGCCSILARSLADCGYAIGVVEEGDSYAHAFIYLDDEHVLDIWGVRSVSALSDAWTSEDGNFSTREVDDAWFDGKFIGSMGLPEDTIRELASTLAAKFDELTSLEFAPLASASTDRATPRTLQC